MPTVRKYLTVQRTALFVQNIVDPCCTSIRASIHVVYLLTVHLHCLYRILLTRSLINIIFETNVISSTCVFMLIIPEIKFVPFVHFIEI